MYRDAANQPSAAELAGILRDESRWPKKDGETFEWNFLSSNCCAMKIAQLTWTPERADRTPTYGEIADLIGINHYTARDIFTRSIRSFWAPKLMPEDVAADLEAV